MACIFYNMPYVFSISQNPTKKAVCFCDNKQLGNLVNGLFLFCIFSQHISYQLFQLAIRLRLKIKKLGIYLLRLHFHYLYVHNLVFGMSSYRSQNYK